MNIDIYDNINYKKIIAGKKLVQKYIKSCRDSVELCPLEVLSLFIPSFENMLCEFLSEEDLQVLYPFFEKINSTEKMSFDINSIKSIYEISLRKKFDDETSKKIILVFADYLNNNVDIINDINIDILKSLLN